MTQVHGFAIGMILINLSETETVIPVPQTVMIALILTDNCMSFPISLVLRARDFTPGTPALNTHLQQRLRPALVIARIIAKAGKSIIRMFTVASGRPAAKIEEIPHRLLMECQTVPPQRLDM
jgi:hypothetical protein